MKKAINNNLLILLLIPIIVLAVYYYYFYYYSSSKIKKMNVNERMRVITEMYTMVADIAEKEDIKAFLLFGSLLGQQRNNRIICYDYDFDMGILSTDFNKLYKALNEKIDKNKYKILLSDNVLSKHIFITDRKKLIDLDIFIYEEDHNGSIKRCVAYLSFLFLKYFRNQCNRRYIPRDWFLPLRPVSFLGKNTYIPNNPKALLECEYGKNYLIPNHKCDNECANCVKI